MPSKAQPQNQKPTPKGGFFRVDVVVTTHNYTRYLHQCLESIRDAHKIIVVDDSSTDSPKQITDQFPNVLYVRTNVCNAHKARAAGFQHVVSPLVCFLDADNYHSPNYIKMAISLFEQNNNLAIVYPNLQHFGDSTLLSSFPSTQNLLRLNNENYMDTGSVILTEAIKQTKLFNDHCFEMFEDWWLARKILNSGPWEAQVNPIPLNYRVHKKQKSRGFKGVPYFRRIETQLETVTVFTTFSDRVQKYPQLWSRRLDWLNEQTWPKIRLVVANTSHSPLPADWVTGLPQLEGLATYNHYVGTRGLESVKRNDEQVESNVQTAVAAIYNKMWKETSTEYILILEDDVFPQQYNTIGQLLSSFELNICAVSGAYRQRHNDTNWTGSVEFLNGCPHNNLVPQKGVQQVRSVGFGCLMVRRSQMSHLPIRGNTSISKYFDPDLFERLRNDYRFPMINWDVTCDHVTNTD